MHIYILLPEWQFVLSGGIEFFLSPRAVNLTFPCHRIGKIVLDVSDRRFHISVSIHQQQSIIIEQSVKLFSLVNVIPLRDHILICGDLNALLTADGCRVRNVCGELNSYSEAIQAFINLHDLIAANGIMRKK